MLGAARRRLFSVRVLGIIDVLVHDERGALHHTSRRVASFRQRRIVPTGRYPPPWLCNFGAYGPNTRARTTPAVGKWCWVVVCVWVRTLVPAAFPSRICLMAPYLPKISYIWRSTRCQQRECARAQARRRAGAQARRRGRAGVLTSSEVILNGRFLGTHVHALSESGHTSTERERSPNTGAPNIQHAVDLWREPRLCTATTRAVSVSRSKIPGAARMATRAHVALPPGGAAHPSSRASAQRRHFPAMNSVCTSATGRVSRYPAIPLTHMPLCKHVQPRRSSGKRRASTDLGKMPI